MRKGLKMVAFVLDVIFMPIRALIGVEVIIAQAILTDERVKDALLAYGKFIINDYPSLVKKAYKIIFK